MGDPCHGSYNHLGRLRAHPPPLDAAAAGTPPQQRHIQLLRRALKRRHCERIIVQAVVDEHRALGVAAALPVHVAALGLDVVRSDLAPVVRRQYRQLDRAAPLVGLQDPAAVVGVVRPQEALVIRACGAAGAPEGGGAR